MLQLKRNSQPQVSTALDTQYGNFVVYNAAIEREVSGGVGGPPSFGSRKPTGIGYARGGDRTAGWAVRFFILSGNSINIQAKNAFTIVISGIRTAATDTSLFEFMTSGFSNLGTGIRFGQVRPTGMGLTGSNINLPSQSVGLQYTIAITYRSGSLKVWQNGAYVGESVITGSITTNPGGVTFGNMPGVAFGDPFDVALTLVSDSAVSDGLARSLTINPWQLFAPIDRQVWTGLSTQVQQVTIARPASDIIVAGWSASTGSDLYAMLDETVASDTDYIISPTLAASNDPVILGLSSALDAGTWAVKMRVKATTGTGDVRASLLDGSNTVVGISEWLPVTGDFSEYTFSVNSSAQATRVRIEVRE